MRSQFSHSSRTRSTSLSVLVAGAAALVAMAAFAGNDAPMGEPKPAAEQPAKVAAAAKVDYVKDVKPILAAHCYKCHGAEKQESGLRLHVKTAAMAGGDGGPIVKPGDAKSSALVNRVAGIGDDERMPPPGKGDALSPREIDLLRRWVDEGAVWPDGVDGEGQRAPHWAYQKPERRPPPDVSNADWCRTAIDRFVLARLDAERMQPNGAAERARLLRRASLDLIGLPPMMEETAAFVADGNPDAYERAVDRLLASPRYGEKWAAMWLDLARYADTQGYEKDNRRTIWRYRDWVIDAFNRNLPFDQFTIEQLAGDLLPNATADQVLATAFHRNTMTNTEGGTDNEEFRTAAVVDRVNTTWAIWMATTMGCCQCHSHKYDPFTQREFYQFFAFLNQTEDADNDDESPTAPMPTREQRAATARRQAELAALEAQLATPSPELDAAAQAWADKLSSPIQWHTITPREVMSTDGATLTPQGDGSVLASGKRPAQDLYSITSDVISKDAFGGDITAFRLEALPEATLPYGGSGRADDGNFVLSGFMVGTLPAAAKPARGQFVRIELPGGGRPLSLAEVQVYTSAEGDGGAKQDAINIALKGKATQSSTEYDAAADRAIDGQTNGDFAAKSTTHTKTEDNPWWEVDLGGVQAIDRIVLWNRTDHGQEKRLAGCCVKLLDAARQVVWEAMVSDVPDPDTSLSPSNVLTVPLSFASADFSQQGFDVATTLKSTKPRKSGWAVQPKITEPHEAIYVAATPLTATGKRLRFMLVHAFERPHFTLGRFRLSVTTDANIAEKHALPLAVRTILAAPADQRTTEQRAILAAHFRQIAPQTAALRQQIVALKMRLAKDDAPRIPVLRELPKALARKTNLMVRGNFLDKGEQVSPGVPKVLHPPAADVPADRLAMARWIASPDNPLAGRVLVNRLWERLFGIGIVETTEDFGIQGAKPSHPELLDWMATELVRQEWDIKATLRGIVSSAVYRQSSSVTPDALARDAYNRLLARGPRVRLSAEQVRDQALAATGLLSTKMLGPSVMPPQPAGVWQVVYSGDQWTTPLGEDRYRRGLYTFWRRTAPYPAMAAFDAPSREFCVLRRPKSNTPLQALVTLNDPAYIEAAQALARQIVAEGGGATKTRAAYALRRCLAREPSAKEVDRVAVLYETELAHFQQDADAAKKMASSQLGPLPPGGNAAEFAAWTVVANVVLNLDEVITKG